MHEKSWETDAPSRWKITDFEGMEISYFIT